MLTFEGLVLRRRGGGNFFVLSLLSYCTRIGEERQKGEEFLGAFSGDPFDFIRPGR